MSNDLVVLELLKNKLNSMDTSLYRDCKNYETCYNNWLDNEFPNTDILTIEYTPSYLLERFHPLVYGEILTLFSKKLFKIN